MRSSPATDSSDHAVRFTAEWLSPAGWVPLDGPATSPWQEAGSAEYTWAQAGWTYDLTVPPTNAYQLRASPRWTGTSAARRRSAAPAASAASVEQPRVVRDHAVHAHRLERAIRFASSTVHT